MNNLEKKKKLRRISFCGLRRVKNNGKRIYIYNNLRKGKERKGKERKEKREDRSFYKSKKK